VTEAVDPRTLDVVAIQRRTLRVLTVGQIIGSAALGSAVTVGAFVIQQILDQDTPWAGIATATVTLGTAVMSQLLSRYMQTAGRRPGLQTGYFLGALGCWLAAWGAQIESLPLFLVGLFLFGNGQASNLLARYTATDLAEENERGQAMSRIVFSSTFGAVFGPLLIGPWQYVGEEWLGLAKYTAPFLFSGLFLFVAFANTLLRLRPDPLHVAAQLRGTTMAASKPDLRIGSTLRSAWESPMARLAILAMIVSQATMVAVMAMTPVHLKLHGHEGVSPFVISLHIAGMYAFSPWVGRYADKHGRLATIEMAAFLLVTATLLSALSGDVEQLLFPSLWLLGIGWNFGLIGGSSLLIDATEPAKRVATQGVADLMMSFWGGLAGFASGFIRKAIGYHLLSAGATVAAGILLAAVYARKARLASAM
jgi:MFS family permease